MIDVSKVSLVRTFKYLIQVNLDNMYRLSKALFPPEPKVRTPSTHSHAFTQSPSYIMPLRNVLLNALYLLLSGC